MSTTLDLVNALKSELKASGITYAELARHLQTAREDERAHLARELHDEFGQRLTALRVDAAWLQQRL